MQLLQVRVRQSLINCDSLLRIIGQHPLEEVDGLRVSTLEDLVEVFGLTFWQLQNKISVFFIFDLIDEFRTRVS